MVRILPWALALFMASTPSIASTHAGPFDQNGCTGGAQFVNGAWTLTCTGSSCTAPPACQSMAGGVAGATYTFCGCSGMGTPECCFVAVDDGGTPWGNGWFRSSGPPGSHQGCPAGNDCNSNEVEGSGGNQEQAECEKKTQPA